MSNYQKDDDFLATRARTFSGQRNYEYDTHELDDSGNLRKKEDALTEHEWRKQMVDMFTAIQDDCEYCYFIFHDKDVLPNGDKKGLHVHFVIKFKNPRVIRSIMKTFGISRTENISKVKSVKGSLSYLLHITKQARKDGKFIYGQDRLYKVGTDISEDDNFEHFNKLTVSDKDDKDIKDEIVEEVLSQVTSLREKGEMADIKILYKKFPTHKNLVSDIYYNYTTKREYAEREYFADKLRHRNKHGRWLRNLYITGKGGTGKTTLANKLGYAFADKRGVHVGAAKSPDKTYDPMGTYKNQKVTILNEMQGSLFDYREIMNVFDDHQQAPVSSRTKDINWTADYLIMTSSKSFERFRNETLRYSKGGKHLVEELPTGQLKVRDNIGDEYKDVAFQFTRRFSNYIEIFTSKGQKYINVFQFNFKKRGFVLQTQMAVSDEFYKHENEMDKVVSMIVKCINDKESVIDMTNGKVKRDADIDQDEQYVDGFRFYREKIRFNYKEYNVETLCNPHRPLYESLLLELEESGAKEYCDNHKNEYHEYVLRVKLEQENNPEVKKESDIVDEEIKHMRNEYDDLYWKLEFYDYVNGNIPCKGLTMREERNGFTLQNKIDTLDKIQQESKADLDAIERIYKQGLSGYPIEIVEDIQKRLLTDKERLTIDRNELDKFIEDNKCADYKNAIPEEELPVCLALWEREFYDLENDIIPCKGPMYAQIKVGVTLNDMIKMYDENPLKELEEKNAKRAQKIKENENFKELNERRGITEDMINEFVKS